MAPKYAVALLVAAIMCAGTLANDVPVKFCAQKCDGSALKGYVVHLTGCTDRPSTCTTGDDGCCAIDRSPDVIQYCYGSATYLCQWNILSGYMGDAQNPFVADTQTFMKDGAPVTPRQFSHCMCNGKDKCDPVVYGDGTNPYTVIFKPRSCSCVTSNKGTSFVVAFPPNYPASEGSSVSYLTLAADVATVATVSYQGTTQTITMAPGTTSTIQLAAGFLQTMANIAQSLTAQVTATHPIALYAVESSDATGDGTLVLPVEALGSSYIAQSYGGNTGSYIQIATTAAHPMTSITVVTLVDSTLGPAGSYTLELAALKSFLILVSDNAKDLSGTTLTGSAPFALFVGNRCANAPVGCGYCDLMWEQVTPTNTWGTNFLIGSFFESSTFQPTCASDSHFNVQGDVVQIIAAQDGTTFTYNGQNLGPTGGAGYVFPLPTLNAGQVYNFPLPATTSGYITASKPVQVMQLMTGSVARHDLGDPLMAAVPATNQWANSYLFSIETYTYFGNGYVNLMYIGNNPTGVLVDNTPVPSASWSSATMAGVGDTYVARLPLTVDTHTVRHTNPSETVGVMIYGIGNYGGYGMPAGMTFPKSL